MKKLWAVGIYEDDIRGEPSREGYLLADTWENAQRLVRLVEPGEYSLVTIDISDFASFNPEAFPKNGVLWKPIQKAGFQTGVKTEMPKR